MQIPTTMVTIQVIEGKEEFVVKSQVMMLGEAINTVCLEYLAQTAPSWKIALGASGTFTFDTNKMNIVMVFGKRIIRRTHQAEARHAHLKKETATVMLGRICYLGLNSNSRIFGNKDSIAQIHYATLGLVLSLGSKIEDNFPPGSRKQRLNQLMRGSTMRCDVNSTNFLCDKVHIGRNDSNLRLLNIHFKQVNALEG